MKKLLRKLTCLLVIPMTATLLCAQDGPESPQNVVAEDKPLDGGDKVVLTWQVPDSSTAEYYIISRTRTRKAVQDSADAEYEREYNDRVKKAVQGAKTEATKAIVDAAGDAVAKYVDSEDPDDLPADIRAQIREAREVAGEAASIAKKAELKDGVDDLEWLFLSNVLATEGKTPTGSGATDFTYICEKLDRSMVYQFRVVAVDPDGTRSAPVSTASITPSMQPIDGSRLWFLGIAAVFCGAVIYFIVMARSGREMKVRKIGGLEAVDEAVGRATEMGRSVLFIPGIQDMNEVQTIAGITVLARVAGVSAEYDARVEVPTARALVMTTARETVEAAYMEAGRPDAYNADNIYYVTNEQFGYVAYLSGMMVREKPAACFYMGMFYAESLILAETGNAIGAIQIAGTAQPAQLPFFVAACDYTLIGEEFFAASAYLSGSPEELGSLKGQDVGKLIVAILLIVGVVLATIAEMTDSDGIGDIVNYLRDTILA